MKYDRAIAECSIRILPAETRQTITQYIERGNYQPGKDHKKKNEKKLWIDLIALNDSTTT